MSIVLQCPVCDSSFQVLPEQAGQLVACPSCSETVSIPEDIAGPAETPQDVFACPFCSGQFGVTPDMAGSQVACPHCQKHVQIEGPAEQPSPTSQKNAGGEDDLFAPGYKPKKEEQINVNVKKTKKKKAKISVPEPTAEPAKPDNKKDRFKGDPFLPPPKKNETKKEADAPKPASQKDVAKKKTASAPPKRKTKSGQAKKNREAAVHPDQQRTASGDLFSPDGAGPVKSKLPQKVSEPQTDKNPKTKSDDAPKVDKAAKESQPEPPKTNPDRGSVAHRLPPKFTAFDPDVEKQLALRNVDENKVILPDAQGGYQQLDARVVHVERDGNKVQLYSAPKDQKERKRTVQNLIAILVGIIVLGLAFYGLLNL